MEAVSGIDGSTAKPSSFDENTQRRILESNDFGDEKENPNAKAIAFNWVLISHDPREI